MKRKAQKRLQSEAKKQGKKKFTLLELQKALSIALEMKKDTGGHLFKDHLKNHCVFCGEDTKTKKKCDWWFLTYLDRVQTILINPLFFQGDDSQAKWLQQGEDYKQIKVPTKTKATKL